MWNVWQFIGGVLGGALSGAGLIAFFASAVKARWLAAVRAGYEEQLERLKDDLQVKQNLLQMKLDQVTFVSRAQFDAEFGAMREIFALATEAKIHLAGLRPFYDIVPAVETPEERSKRLAERYDEVAKAYNPFANKLESLSPFYPEALHGALTGFRKAINLELNQVRTAAPGFVFSPAWYEQGELNKEKALECYSRAAEVIRLRLAHLSVLGTS